VASDSLVLNSSDPLQPAFSFYLAGRGTEPDITVTPDSLFFGNVTVLTADTLPLTLDNSGNGDLLIDSVRFLLDLTEFSLTQPFADGTVVPPGGGPVALPVEFAPGSIADSTFVDTLLFYSDDPDEPLVRVPLNGTSVTAGIQLSRDSIDYGVVFLGASADSALYVISGGSDTLRFTSTMTAPLDFAAVPSSADVAPGDSELVVITYSAVTAGSLSAAWNLLTNVPGQAAVPVALTATGTSRLAVVDTLSFGQLALGASSSRELVLTNLSAVTSDTLQLDSIVLPAGVVAIDTPVFPLFIAPTEADTLTLRWAPATASTLNAPLTIYYVEPLVAAPQSRSVQLVGSTTTTDRTIVTLINYPNPFIPEDQTTILVGLSQDASVTLTIYDLAGHALAELVVDQVYAAGEHEIVWNGQRFDGRSVAYGVYICEVAAKPTAGGDEDREYRKLACGRR
jgi:hypothetical protein